MINWLNESFFDIAFNTQEKKVIKFTNVVNSVGQNTKHKCTEDFVFCLTADEAKGYFVKDSYRSALGIGGEASRWWLRNPGYGKVSADVTFDGTIDESGCQVTGPGKITLQTMPKSQLAAEIASMVPSK